MKNKLVEEAPYHPGYEDVGFEPTTTNVTYKMTEDDAAKYWYNKGHEDGRKLAIAKELAHKENKE